jgi:hypothetical protein
MGVVLKDQHVVEFQRGRLTAYPTSSISYSRKGTSRDFSLGNVSFSRLLSGGPNTTIMYLVLENMVFGI